MELLWLTPATGQEYAFELTGMLKALRAEENILVGEKKPARLKAYQVEFRDPKTLILVIKEGEAVAAMATFTVGVMGFINRLYVKPAFRRRGYGDVLMSNIKEYMTKHGVVEYTVNVIPNNHPAIALYQKHGLLPYYLSMYGKPYH